MNLVPKVRQRCHVIGAPIDIISWSDAIGTLHGWAAARESRFVCICNVHSVVTALQNPAFRRTVEAADMATPDGAPVAWTMRRKGFTRQERINGPDLMWRLCAAAEASGLSIGLFGSSQQTLEELERALSRTFPGLRVAYSVSPPFRALSMQEDDAIVRQINSSGAGLLFVGLGCPKQEEWMAEHRGRVNAVMIGVGAAFDYHAGTLPRAPDWMRSSGLEWLFRVLSEPRRLWKRYLLTNSVFIWRTAVEFLDPRARASEATQRNSGKR